MNDNDSLSPEERNQLLAAAQAKKSSRFAAAQKENQKKNVSPEEYLRRLDAARKRDMSVLGAVRDEKTNKAVKEWAAKVGPTFANAETAYIQIAERLERMRTKQGLHKTSILFHGGEYGRGKTWAAYSYINRLVGQGTILPGQIFFGTESSTLSRVANSGFERSEEMKEMKRDSHKVFFIDDVGQGYFFKKEHREEVWYELIDHVYTKRLTLILTTNLSFRENGPNSLGNHLGGRAFDRLRTLVGDDGVLEIRGINRRDEIFHQNEAQYRSKGKKA